MSEFVSIPKELAVVKLHTDEQWAAAMNFLNKEEGVCSEVVAATFLKPYEWTMVPSKKREFTTTSEAIDATVEKLRKFAESEKLTQEECELIEWASQIISMAFSREG